MCRIKRYNSLPVDSALPGANLFLLLLSLGEPARGDTLGFGKKVDAVEAENVALAKKRLLMTGEREKTHRYRDAYVNTNHAGMRSAGKLTSIVAALSEDTGTIGKTAVVHEGDAIFKIPDTLNAKHRTEDLLTANGHILGHVVEDGRAHKEALFKARNNQIAPVKDQVGAFLHPCQSNS